jgi:hypothetical protein
VLDAVATLLAELTARGGQWPPRRHAAAWREIRTWRAFLENDRQTLEEVADWTTGRPYKIDPLPELIADAWADHIFAEDLEVEAAADSDSGTLDMMLEENGDFLGDLHAAERENVAEGEKWWRVYVDRDIADAPLLEWHSRDSVIPLYVGRRLVAAALITDLAAPPSGAGSRSHWRHFEVHVDGAVEHVLFRGNASRLGVAVPLTDHPQLADLAAELGEDQVWTHGLPMLMGRVINRRPRRGRNHGTSDFEGITDYLLDLNEAVTIGAENARLTAKRRVVMSENAVRPAELALEDRGDGILTRVNGRGAGVDLGDDVIVVPKLDQALGTDSEGPFKVLEYSYDAVALIAHKRDLVESAVTRRGLTPVYIGVATGEAPGVLSGTAYRLKLIPTTKAGKGKARPWDDTIPQALALMAQVDALPEADGGFGRSWADPTTPPAVTRPNALPRDDVEDATVEATLVSAGVRSRRTSVKAQHPDWTDDLVDAELEELKADRASSSAGSGLLGLPGGA